MERLKLVRRAAVLALGLALAPGLAAAQDADTLSISGTFRGVGGIVLSGGIEYPGMLGADLTLAVSGAGGPEPQDDQPPCTVWFAVDDRGETQAWVEEFPGDDPQEVLRCTREGILINTFMLDATSYLTAFVERLTEINRGRAFFTTPEDLGDYVLVDFIEHKRQQGRVRRAG